MREAPKLYRDADSRITHTNFSVRVSDPSGLYERTYCPFCGSTSGWTSKESSQFIRPAHIVVTCSTCDEDIIEKYGKDNFPLQEVPQHLLDAYGIIPEKKE